MDFKEDFELLGFQQPTSDETLIKKGYRNEAKKYHPDGNKTPEAQERMKRINIAYARIKDAIKNGTDFTKDWGTGQQASGSNTNANARGDSAKQQQTPGGGQQHSTNTNANTQSNNAGQQQRPPNTGQQYTSGATWQTSYTARERVLAAIQNIQKRFGRTIDYSISNNCDYAVLRNIPLGAAWSKSASNVLIIFSPFLMVYVDDDLTDRVKGNVCSKLFIPVNDMMKRGWVALCIHIFKADEDLCKIVDIFQNPECRC